jgi:hypothetical protein
VNWQPHDLDAELAEGIEMVRALRACARAGLLLNNLFQMPGGTWRCNVRREDGTGMDFGDGASPPAALRAALSKAEGGGRREEEGQGRQEVLTTDTPVASVEDAAGVFS